MLELNPGFAIVASVETAFFGVRSHCCLRRVKKKYVSIKRLSVRESVTYHNKNLFVTLLLFTSSINNMGVIFYE